MALLTATLLALAGAETCELLRTEPYGHIQSEDGDYDNYHHQCWLIQPTGASRITLSFQQFSTEAWYDKLRVYDGSTTAARELTPSGGLSGSALPAPITSSGGALLVLFISDYSRRAAGFTFAWTAVAAGSQPLPDGWCTTGCDPSKQTNDECDDACFNAACGWEGEKCSALCNATSGCRKSQMNDGNCDPECYNQECGFDSHDCECETRLTAAYGVIRDTPNSSMTADYDNNVRRCWIIEAQPGQRLSLSFERFDVEARFDRLRIYDGRSAAAPPLHQLAPPLHDAWGLSGLYDTEAVARLCFNSSGDALLIRFDSDSSITESGFLLGWTPLTPPAGLCALDCTEEKRHNEACDLACMNEQCEWDSGECGEARPCATGCDGTMLGNGECDSACYTESCNWDLRDCECATVLDATSGFRTDGSPPGTDYPINQDLCWLIRPKQRNVTSLTLSFARFDIEDHFDQLRIYDGSFSRLDQLHGIVSGTELPATFASAGPALLLEFHSDYSITESGFLFGWTSDISGQPLPAAECAHGCVADTMLADGLCHPRCMNEACGFDGGRLGEGGWHGGDCSGTCFEGTDEASPCYAAQLGDGKCDLECLRAECNFDHRDCECNDVLAERAGFHAHGGAQADYVNNERLCWLIRPKAPQRDLVAKISLSFRRFDVERRFDKLRIFNGSNVYAPLLIEASGEKHGDALLDTFVETTGGGLLITFESDYAVTESGFLFGWTSDLASDPPHPADMCAFNCTAAMRGNGVCDAACMNAQCEWDAAPGATRGDCDAECSPHCTLDMLDNEVCDRSCAVEACNFDYRDCECANVLDVCDGSYTDGSGPHAPYNLDESRCWLIRPKRDRDVLSRLTLHWDRFETEVYNDKVRVFDGRSKFDRPLHVGDGWSGSIMPPDVTSSGSELLLTFTTDHSRSAAGFAFSWSCMGEIDLGAGETPGTSPNLLLNPHMLERPNTALRGWNITRDGVPGAVGHEVVESISLQPCCSLAPDPGGRLLATSSTGWFVREQEVDLVALGFAPTYLDTAPAVHVSERFAQLPPASGLYFLWAQLLDADRRPLSGAGHEASTWGRNGQDSHWSFAQAGSPLCSAATCQLANGDSVWATQAHDFVGYGPGLRYVLWRDGGRGDEEPGGLQGAVPASQGAILASPSLALATAPPGSCALECMHGECGPGGGCKCERGWEGELCSVHVRTTLPTTCGLDCSGHGTCVSAERTSQSFSFCRCESGYLGTYCSVQTDDVAGPSCASAHAGSSSTYRRGIFVSVDAPYSVSNEVVNDGLVTSTWRGDGAAPRLGASHGNGTRFYVWLVDEDAVEPVQLGAPRLSPRDRTPLSVKVSLVAQRFSRLAFVEEWVPELPGLVEERDDWRLRLAHGGAPLQLHVEYACRGVVGETAVELELPVSGFCPLALTWRHRCDPEDADGPWLAWLAALGCSACLSFACLRRGLCTRGQARRLMGAGPGTVMLRPAEEMPVGWLHVARCAASSAWCRLQLARDEMRSGGGLVGAANVLFQGSSDDPEGVRGSMMAGGRLGPEGDFPLGGMHRLETRTRATDRDDDLNEML